MDQYTGGSWTMIPTHSGGTPQSNQDSMYFSPQQQPQQITQQQFQYPLQQTQQQQFHQQQQLYLQQQPQQPLITQQQQQNQHQSLASHFHLLHLVENLADVIEHGTRDQQSEALINELSSQFEKCQQLLNSIAGSISSKAMTVEGQKKKLEESEQLLNQRRDLLAKYRNSVEELSKSKP